MTAWVRRKIVEWLNAGNIKMIVAQQKMINQLEAAIRHLRDEVAESRKVDPNPHKDIANLEQRIDALCTVCGVEVVITDGEVFTKVIDPPSSAQCEAAAAAHELVKEISNSYRRLTAAETVLRTIKRK